MPSGVLLLDKPEGMSSNGVLDELKHILRDRLGLKTRDLPKLGHTGTLDPFATGLLPVVIGDAAKLSRYLIGSDKSYRARMKLGVKTATADLTGELTETASVPTLTASQVKAFALMFCESPYLQTPPMFSAKKQDGKPLYELARQGIEVERKAVPCTIRDFIIESVEADTIEFSVCVSAGTYIRTLAEDFAVKLGTVAHLTQLRRTTVSLWSIDQAVSLDTVKKNLTDLASLTRLGGWIEFDRLLDKFPRIEIDAGQALALVHGKQDALSRLIFNEPGVHALIFQKRIIATVTNGPSGPTIERVMVDQNQLKTWSQGS